MKLVDSGVSNNCKNIYSYGEICLGCNQCNRFGESVPVITDFENAPENEDMTTNGQAIRASDETLADFILQSQKRDPSLLWCKDGNCYRLLEEDPEAFDCTDERHKACLLRWLGS